MFEIQNGAEFARFKAASEVGVLYVSSTWWPPRDRAQALLHHLAGQLEPHVSLACVNADQCGELCQDLNVRSVPEVLIFQQGQEVRRFQGRHVSAERIQLGVALILVSSVFAASGRQRASRGSQFADHVSLFCEPPVLRTAGVLICDLPKLDVVQARWLADQKETLLLTHLTAMSPPVAAALAEHRGVLSLANLRKLDPETAYALGRFRGQALVLDGLRTLNADVAGLLSDIAEPLGDQRGMLSLAGVRRISPLAAQALSLHCGELILDGLRDLVAKVAIRLAEHRGSLISLGGLQTIDAESARCLAQYPGTLCLTGVRSLTDCAADELFAARGQLELYDHPELSAYARERLRLFL